jgi:EAL and modified HD-GYP domain-containing signal transduction protein
MGDPVFIRREPVINRHRTIIANRLIVHADNAAEAAQALLELADTWPPARSVMIALAGCLPTPDLLAWSPPANVMVEIPAPALGSPATEELIARLRADGIPLCLSAYAPGLASPEASFRFLIADYAAYPEFVDPPALPLAQQLADSDAFDAAIAQGYAGACGWFFLRGEHPWGPLKTNHAQAVRVLNLVRKNAEVGEIEAALKQDVTLSFKLLRYINSAAFGLGKEIQSFRHAVTLLGYDKLNKWLSLLLVTASNNPIAPALMQTAIARSRFMEIAAAGRFDAIQSDNLFIAGAFSLLDLLLGTHIDEVLAEMHLPASISDALLRRGGEFAPYLELALACENEDPAHMIALAGQLGLSAAQLNHAQLAALAFADSLQFN